MRKQKLEKDNKRVLTDSIINFNSNFNASLANLQFCVFCNKDLGQSVEGTKINLSEGMWGRFGVKGG